MKSFKIKYSYFDISSCNMCGSEVQKVLGKRLNTNQGFNPRKKKGLSTTIVKCRNCGLIYSDPLPIPENISDHYGTPPESYWGKDYFDIEEDYFVPQIQTFFNLIDEKSEKKIKALDIGAGIGKCILALEKAGFDVIGIEPSKTFYEKGLKHLNISEKIFYNCSVEEAFFEEASFDFITYGAVLEHFYDPSDSINKAMKWLKKGGLLHIEVPNAKWLTSRLINIVYKIQGLDYCTNISPMHSPFHLYEFDLQSFKEHSIQNGYEIAFSKYLVCSTFLPKIFNFVLKPLMNITNTGLQLEIWLRRT